MTVPESAENLIVATCLSLAGLGFGLGILLSFGSAWLPTRVLRWLDGEPTEVPAVTR